MNRSMFSIQDFLSGLLFAFCLAMILYIWPCIFCMMGGVQK